MKADVTWASIADAVNGTTWLNARIAEQYGLTPEEEVQIEDRLEEEGVIFCVQCGWWTDDHNGELCNACQEENDEDEDEDE